MQRILNPPSPQQLTYRRARREPDKLGVVALREEIKLALVAAQDHKPSLALQPSSSTL